MRIVNILGSIVESGVGTIVARIGSYFGDAGTAEVASENTDIWQHYGFASRPKPADENGCCEGLVQRMGSQERVVATRDLRSTKALGSLEEGDSAIYADVDTDAIATVATKVNGMIYLNSPVEIVNGSTKTANVIFLDPKTNVISIAHESGKSIMINEDIIQLKCGNSLIQLSEAGITIAGKITLVGSIAMDPTSTLICGSIIAAGPIKGNPVVP